MSGPSDQGFAVVAGFSDRLRRPVEEVAADLESFCELLGRWQKVQNLVSRETRDDLWDRHIADSLQLLDYLRPSDRVIVDLGSGGGFPALPLAIALKGDDHVFHLIESNGRKVAFLRAAARKFALPVTVHNCRIEQIDPSTIGPVDVITSRALTDFPRLLALLAPFWRPETHALLHKGGSLEAEMAKTPVGFRFHMVKHPSQTGDSGVIVEITDLQNRTDGRVENPEN